MAAESPVAPPASHSPKPSSRIELIDDYGTGRGHLQVLIAVLWTFALIGLGVLFVLYTYLRGISSGYSWFAVSVVTCILLWILSLGESAELAETALRDKDLEQLTDSQSRKTLDLVKKKESDFLNGKQAVVVAIIVLVTLISAQLVNIDAHGIAAARLPSGIREFLLNPVVRGAFAFGFPNFVVLWVAQLYPKQIAASDPVSTFSSFTHRKFIELVIEFERFVNIGAPSIVLGVILRGRRLDQGFDPASQLRPSRHQFYRSMCTFVYGLGIEDADREIVVRNDGSVEVSARQTIEAYVEGVRELSSFESWAASIVASSVRLGVQTVPFNPENQPRIEKTVSLAEIDGEPIPDGKLAWRIEFPEPLPVHSRCFLELRYETKPGAFKKEYYSASIGAPMRMLNLVVRPDQGSQRRFFEGQCQFEGFAHNRDSLRQVEDARVHPESYKGGYKVGVELPSVGSRLKLSWQSKGEDPNSSSPAVNP